MIFIFPGEEERGMFPALGLRGHTLVKPCQS